MTLTATESQSIREALDRYLEAWNGRNAKECARLYSTDGDLLAADGTFLRTPNDVERYYSKQLSGPYSDFRINNLDIVSLRSIGHRVAMIDAKWDVTAPAVAGHVDVVAAPVGTFVLTASDDGRWQFAAVRIMVPFSLKQTSAAEQALHPSAPRASTQS